MFEDSLTMMQQMSVLALLGICSIEDVKTKRIHVIWLAVFAAEGILCSVLFWKRPLGEILTAMMPGILILVLSAAVSGSIGEGDGMLLTITGIFLEVSFVLSMLTVAVFLSAGYALFLYVIRKKSRKYEMPFIPFLLIAFIGVILSERYL